MYDGSWKKSDFSGQNLETVVFGIGQIGSVGSTADLRIEVNVKGVESTRMDGDEYIIKMCAS